MLITPSSMNCSWRWTDRDGWQVTGWEHALLQFTAYLIPREAGVSSLSTLQTYTRAIHTYLHTYTVPLLRLSVHSPLTRMGRGKQQWNSTPSTLRAPALRPMAQAFCSIPSPPIKFLHILRIQTFSAFYFTTPCINSPKGCVGNEGSPLLCTFPALTYFLQQVFYKKQQPKKSISKKALQNKQGKSLLLPPPSA